MSTVRVRPLSYAEVQRLAQGEEISAFKAEYDGLVPVTLSVRSTQIGKPGRPVQPTEPYQRADGSTERRSIRGAEPVGYSVSVESRTIYGTEQGQTFFTTLEAERETDLQGNYSFKASEPRLKFGIEAGPDEEGTEMALVPTYGSQVSLTMFLADVNHEDALERALAALHREFGDDEDIVRIHRPSSRPVRDRRVNVYARARGGDHEERLVAANVLEAEASYYANTSTYRTTSAEDGEPEIKIGPKRRSTLRTDASGRKPRA